MLPPISIYIHWPFCVSKCPYCDFNSHVATADFLSNSPTPKQYISKDIEQIFLQAYEKQLNTYANILKQRKLISIFFGGGTPSLMSINMIAELLAIVNKYISIDSNVEISLEANPSSVEIEKFIGFKQAGINRISIGVQSFSSENLHILGRTHSESEAKRAIEIGSKVFDNYSFDLMYALPGQKLEDWIKELELARSYANKHLSLYQLTIEKGTKFFSMYKNNYFSKNNIKLPDDQESEEMYIYTMEALAKIGMYRYEISNYAVHGSECQHNMAYWRYNDYIGIGAGAHSRFFDGKHMHSTMAWHTPKKWLSELIDQNNNAEQLHDLLDANNIVNEIIMMGLRTTEGVNETRLHKLTSLHFEDIINTDYLAYLEQNKMALIEINNNTRYLKLTNKALNFHNFIVSRLLKNDKMILINSTSSGSF